MHGSGSDVNKRTKKATRTEKHALQILTASPYNAWPFNFLISMRSLSLPIEFASLQDMAPSASLRCAWRSSSSVPFAAARIAERWLSSESSLFPRHRSFVDAWVSSSASAFLASAVDRFSALHDIPVELLLDKPPNSQARLTRLLRSLRSPDFLRPILRRRLQRWFPLSADAMSRRAFLALGILQRSVRPLLLSDLLATWLNAWCVSARFAVVTPCRFCGTCGPDALSFFYLLP